MTETKNARITSTSLGTPDHGIMSAWVTLEGDGWGVGFGGYALDRWDEAQHRRVGTAYGLDFLMGILDTLQVETWEQLKGQHIRVVFDSPFGKPIKIGHITKDRWFDPSTLEVR